MVSSKNPDWNVFFQPVLISSIEAPWGSTPTYLLGSAAPCAFPKVWPPATRATVSSSFIAILPNVSLISCADFNGSGSPFGPSGFT